MAKDPAFLFYPNDYIGGTMGMTFEEKGAYMELLMMQFNRGHMTKHMIGQTVGQLWVNIEDKFKVDDKGLYYNARLEEEQTKRKNYSESRRNNVSGKNQYTKNPKKKAGHMTLHMENEDENENVIKDEVKNEIKFPFTSDNFKEQWTHWVSYKKGEHNFKFKTPQSQQAALTAIGNLSNNDEVTAVQIIHRSMANGWAGLFKLDKDKQNGKQTTTDKWKRAAKELDDAIQAESDHKLSQQDTD